MIYRLSARLAFESEDPIEDIKDKIQDAWDKVITINPDTPYTERSFYLIERCYHAEDNPIACEVIEEHHTD